MTDERTADVGDNSANMSPYESDLATITDLYNEAKLWLDGEPVTTQKMADDINTLRDLIKKAGNKADENRKAEQKPHKEKVDEVQERYNALIGNNKSVKGLAVKADEACAEALKPFLIALKAKQDEEARLARIEADKKAAEAMAAMRARDGANLEENEKVEQLASEAKKADADARKAENAKAHVKGSASRATGLRTFYVAEMTNFRDAAAWAWNNHSAELREFVQGLADKAVRSNVREIPGFTVKEEYKV